MESIGRLAGGVGHDFNNMLTVIIGFAQLGKAKLSPGSSLAGDLDEIQKAAERANNLTSQLLAFSRRQIITPRVIDLNRLAQDTAGMLRRLIGEDIHLSVRPSSEQKLVKVDPTQFEQVLVNLVVNARDAMPGGGSINVEISDFILDSHCTEPVPLMAEGAYVLLEVRDSGEGMTEEVKEHIFEPFFTTKHSDQGTGLGLATCYGIVAQAGGHIAATSQVAQGTSFKIYLPLAEETD